MKYLPLFFLLLLPFTLSDAVCDERLLIMELKQDIEDNGVLDCLRVIQPPHSYTETVDEKNKRIAAQWDTGCAFEAEYDWMKPLREIHGISNLVDDTGDIVDRDFSDQADMCEIVRAAIASGKFNKITTELTNIPLKILDLIDCPGSVEQSEVCAVTGASYFQNDTWYILLEGLALSIDRKPHFVIAPNEPAMPDIPEAERNLIKGLEGAADSKLKEKIIGAYGKLKKFVQNLGSEEGGETVIVPPSEKTSIIESNPLKAFQTNPLNQFAPFGNANLRINTNDESAVIVVSSSTINFERDRPSHFLVRMTLDGQTQIDARSIQGNGIVNSINTGFITKIKGEHTIALDYRTPGTLTGSRNNPQDVWQDNRYVGALLLHKNLKIKKITAQTSIALPKTEVWTKIKELNLKFNVELDRPCLFLYNIAGPSNNLIATRLSLDGQPLLSSLKAEHPTAYVGLMGLASKIVNAGGERVLTVEYMSKANVEIKPSSDDWQSGGISMLELPITTIIHERFLDGAVSIASDDWNLLGNLKIDLKMEREKNCLIFYAISSTMPLSNWAIYTRVTDNGKEIVSSRASSSTHEEYGISSQFLLNLKPGKHEIQLQYFTGEKNLKIDPSQELQKASLSIIELEAEIAL